MQRGAHNCGWRSVAEVDYPTGMRTLAQTLTPLNPAQIVHRPLTGGSAKVLNRSAGSWGGVVRFGQAQGDQAAKVEAFIASLNGAENYCELPIHRDASPELTIDAQLGGFYSLAADVAGFGVGKYARHGDRLVVITQGTYLAFTIFPRYIIPIGDILEPATTVRAATSRRPPDFPKTPNWSGPWVWQWEERL